MSDKEIKLHGDEVISLSDKDDQFLISHSTFKVNEFWARLIGHCYSRQKWFDEGVDCEILHPGGLWREGKVRIRMEFCPDESENIDSTISGEISDPDLDGIRQIANQEQ